MKPEMKPRWIVLCFLLPLILLTFSCNEEKGKGDYSGVSDLIADRNKARHQIAQRAAQKKVIEKKVASTPKIPVPQKSTKNREISSTVLYEQKIKIIGEQSGQTMAKGIAYVNKQGQIVRIKIIR